MSYEGAMLPVGALDAALRGEMRALLERHFDGVRSDDFEADLAEKDHAVLLRAAGGRLVGFSTLRVYVSRATGAPRRVLFSGDTIVDPEVWRSPYAIRSWLRGVLPLSRGDGPLDWFLLSSGHRTYRAMLAMFDSCYPDPALDRPALRERLHAYARERYGAAYDAAAGVVRLPRSVHRLRPGVGDVTEARLKDPAVALFAAPRRSPPRCAAPSRPGSPTRRSASRPCSAARPTGR
ncbi:MAG TPA: hypothetical protein VFP50_19780 [Anaeromyxobacteraceae bacterium]|nr:hypothetical protein [Anaeromyxobacteraceae bacterium]